MVRGLRARLMVLVSLALVPLAVFAIAGIVHLAQAKRQDFERSLAETVRALGSAVDNELHRSVAVTLALAGSPSLVAGEIPEFYEHAQQVLKQQPNWSSIALSDPDGRYLFSTALPLGASLPQHVGAPQEVVEAAQSGKTMIGNIGLGKLSGQHILAVRTPVFQGGRVRYVISAAVKPDSLRALLERQAVPADATVAVLDRNRQIAARSRQHEQFVGKTATATLQEIMIGRAEGSGMPRTLDGRLTYAAFSTSAQTGWSLVIGLPLDQVGAPQRYAYGVLLVGLALSLGLGAAAAAWFARSIVRPVELLRSAARAIGRGEEVQPTSASFAELQEVSTTLAAASRSLRESTMLRTALLEQEQEARSAAEKASRDKDEFLAMLSHELRNPLAALTNAFELLRRVDEHSDQARSVRQVIDRQLGHLRYLIEDLLEVSRAVTGKVSLSIEVGDLAACVEGAVSELQASGLVREHHLQVSLEPSWAAVDLHRIRQVASNLLTNAARYSPAGTTIGVRVFTEGPTVVLEVSDQGIGMDQATQARVFDLFFQAAVEQDRSSGGLGVGLTLVKRLVELHGGTIDAYSAGPGEGSRFTVRLPAVAAPVQLPVAAVEQPAARRQRRRVLVVDDNRDHADSVAELLRLENCEVAQAYDGEEALVEAARWHPQVVLLDIGLPKRNGHEVCRALRRMPGGQALRIVAVTGWGQESDREKSRAAGFDAHLTKPASYEELLKSLGDQAAD